MSPKIRAQFLTDIDTWKAQWKHCTEQLRARRLAKLSQDGSHEDDSSSTRSLGSSRRKLYMSSVNGSPRMKNDSFTNLLSSPKSPRSPRTPTRAVYAARRVVSTPTSTTELEIERATKSLESRDVIVPTLLPALVMEEGEASVDEVDEPNTDVPDSDDEENEMEPKEPHVEIRKSAWEQLWDDLADFAGIHDPS
jgi:hypothetical protein